MITQPCSAVVVLPHLYVQNANAISSHMTWGFPAMSAFLGFGHALERRLRAAGQRIAIEGVAVVCHHHEPQLAEGPSYAPRAFSLTRNPVLATGETAAITEEGRMHMLISLVLSVTGDDVPKQPGEEARAFAQLVESIALSMRIAGGSVRRHAPQAHRRPQFWTWSSDGRETVQRRVLRGLLPGFALISRQALLVEHTASLQTQAPDATSLDALLDLCALHFEAPQIGDGENSNLASEEVTEPEDAANDEVDFELGIDTESTSSNAEVRVVGKVKWPNPSKLAPGYLVPVPLGYAAISELHPAGSVKSARDNSVPFRFVENVIGLGEWRSPHRVQFIDDLLWQYGPDADAGLYLVSNTPSI